jgi:lipopolysaccharide exporter
MRWSMKAISLMSSIILIRLLAPEDFGLMTKAIISVGLLEVLLDSGFKQALIQKKTTDQSDYDTVFTLNMIFGSAIFIALIGLSPLLSHFMEEPRLTMIIPLLGIRVLVWGMSSPKTADFLRNLEYSKDFWFNVSVKLVSVPSTIIFAFIFKDYRALVGGQIVSQLAELSLSYIMAPYRPRFGLSRVREIWKFSLSFISLNYAIYATQRMDEMFLMHRGGENSNRWLGYYNVANILGCLLTYEVLYPLTRSLFPVFSKLREDKAALSKAVRQVFGIVWALALFCGVGTALMGENLMLALGGEEWRAAIVVLQWVGIASALQMVNLVIGTVLQVTDHAKVQSILLWSKLIMLAGAFSFALPLCFEWNSLEPLALSRAIVMGLFVPVHIFFLKGILELSFTDLLKEIWRPTVVMIYLFLADKELELYIYHFDKPFLNLIIQMLMIGIGYGGGLLLLWRVTGRPKGFESFLINSYKNRKLDFSE